MSSNNKSNISLFNFSIIHILTILFIGLKLGDVIDWNWFWVLSPTIFIFSFNLILIAIILIGIMMARRNVNKDN